MPDTTDRDQLIDLIWRYQDELPAIGLADHLLAAGWRPPPRVITDEDELDALPPGSLVESFRGYAMFHVGSTWKVVEGLDWEYSAAEMTPATVLWLPGGDHA